MIDAFSARPGAGLEAAIEAEIEAHEQAGRYRDAFAACQSLLRRQPDRPDILMRAGRLAMAAGKFELAAKFLAKATQVQPENGEAHFELGNALKAAGHLELALRSYGNALAVAPDALPAWQNYGNTLLALDRAEEAADAYRHILGANLRNPAAQRNLGLALQRMGRLDDAILAYRGALKLQGDWPQASSNLVQALLAAGDPAAAVAACDDWLGHRPGSVEALALKCAALNEAGENAAAARLLDFDRFVTARTIEPPAGYRDLAAFNAALEAAVLAHPTLKVPPEDDPTYHHPRLRITDEILGATDGPLADLEKILTRCVEDYWTHVGEDESHPFLANRPRRWTLSAWSVVLEGEGNLVPHIHLDGYVGGSYYVTIPAEAADEARKEGWFELGRPPEELACTAEPVVRALQPAPGRMLMFPGYFYHRTTPYRSPSGARRITIAFDVVPQD